MISIAVKGYGQGCTTNNSGGVSRMWVADADDFNFTPGTPDAPSSGYSAIARRVGTGATATSTIGSGGVTGVVIGVGGTGYALPPTVVFTGGGGTGAAGTATVVNGVVTGVTITAPGTGYTTAPAVSFVGGGATQAGGGNLFEIVALDDSLTAKATQSIVDGAVQWAFEIGGRLIKMQQSLVDFSAKLDTAAACAQLLWMWQDNNGKIWVAGEKWVGAALITKFKVKQDGSVIDWGAAFNSFNGMTLSAKGNYSRPPYEFTGGAAALTNMFSTE